MEVGTWGALHNWRTWALACISMLEAVVKNAILYWCPLIIHSLARPGPASAPQNHRKLCSGQLKTLVSGDGIGAPTPSSQLM